MRAPTFAVSIANAAHVPERKATLEALLGQLDQGRDARVKLVHTEARPGRPHEWSEWQWRAALESVPPLSLGEASHCLFLNDDVTLCEDFWKVLTAAVEARPRDILSLYCSHPAGPEMRARGAAWYTSPDGLIGNAYVLPRGLLVAFLDWRRTALVDGAVETTSEDGLLNLFAMATGRLIHHTVPSLVDHALPDASCYGNEENPARRATVPPEPGMLALDWTRAPEATGRFFHGSHWRLLTALRPDTWRQTDAIRKAYALERSA